MPVERTKDRRTWRDYLRLTLVQRGSPESIAWGVAVGMFVAFTPTLGVQIVLVLILASILRVNRIAAIPPLFITNVLTAGPVYGFECWLGAQFLPDAKSAEMLARWEKVQHIVAETGILSLHRDWRDLMTIGGDLWLAMWIGGILVGGLLAAVSYVATVAIVRRHRARRARRLQDRARARQPAG
ncbi:MAG: DUF2062 domain-containing protein [Lentisphaerae bacterium]|nr:DUF2062 domain-containing protein [Lentisphaerota bacterium]